MIALGILLLLNTLLCAYTGGILAGLCSLFFCTVIIVFLEIQHKNNVLRVINLLDQLRFPVALLDSKFRYRFLSESWSKFLRVPGLHLMDNHFEKFKAHTSDCKIMYKNALKGETFTGFARALKFSSPSDEEILDFGITGLKLLGRPNTLVFINPKTDLINAKQRADQLYEENQKLKSEIHKCSWHLETLKIINKIANLTVSNDDLQTCLHKALDYIVKIPSVALKPQAGIFIADDEKKELILYCSKNFSPDLATRCRMIEFGECLCGKAAQERAIQFSSCVDEQHTITYQGITPHGHYNVPLIFDEELVGVLVVYLPEGHQRSEFEVELMNTLGFVLAGLIKSKQTVAELTESQKQKEYLLRKQKLFFGAISHDIRNYIQRILSHTELALDSSISAQEAFTQIETASNEILLLLSDLLDLIRLESTHIKLQDEPFLVSNLLDDLNKNFSGRVKPNVNLRLSNECGEIQFFGPIMRIKQVLLNLVSNAIKFTLNGSITVSAWYKREGGSVWLTFQVSDTGIGIPQEKLKTIFDPFSRVDDSSKGQEGYGLGLAICKKLIDTMGGQIQVESTLGYGTTFTVTIPVSICDSHQTDVESTNILVGPLKILTVEDDPVSSKLLSKILEHAGHQVINCNDARTTLQLVASSQDFDLAIVDYELPLMNGITLASKLKELQPTMPIILLTGNESVSNQSDTNEAVSKILIKPITKKLLLAEIAKVTAPAN